MKHLCLPIILATILLLTACAAQKRVWYVQDAQFHTSEQIAQAGQIRIKPLDRLTIVVISRNPELAVSFNSSSFSSFSGTLTSTSGASSLRVRTVDEEGMLDMPVIGRIECRGLTRSELSRAIADRIVEGAASTIPRSTSSLPT